MIYFASYFEPQYHHGTVVSISRSAPKVKYAIAKTPVTPLLAPPPQLLSWFKEVSPTLKTDKEVEGAIAEYRQQYLAHFQIERSKLKEYLDTLSPDEDQTWCCWEPSTPDPSKDIPAAIQTFCHRNFVAAFLEKSYPHLYGGKEMPFRRGEVVTSRYLPDRQYTFIRQIPPNLSTSAENPYCEVATYGGEKLFPLRSWLLRSDAINC